VGVPALLIALGTLYVGPPMHRARRLTFREYRLIEFVASCLLFGAFGTLIGWLC
jgi:hypothetical protein